MELPVGGSLIFGRTITDKSAVTFFIQSIELLYRIGEDQG